MIALKELWEFLNGKKTIIGAMLLIVGAFMGEVIVGIWGFHATVIIKMASTLNWMGMAMGGTGIFHKLIKGDDNPVTDKTE